MKTATINLIRLIKNDNTSDNSGIEFWIDGEYSFGEALILGFEVESGKMVARFGRFDTKQAPVAKWIKDNEFTVTKGTGF